MTSAISADKSDIIQIPKFIQDLQDIHIKTGTVLDIASAVVGAFDALTGKVSAVVKQIFGAMAFVSGFHAVFAIPRIVNSIGRAVRAATVVERVKNAFYAVIDVGSIWMGVNAVLDGLKSIKVLSAEAIGWTSIVNTALFPLQVISVGLDVHNLVETKSQRSEILSKITFTDLTKACRYVIENEESLVSSLRFSKTVQLAKRAQTLFDRLASSTETQDATKDAVDFMKILRRRINTKYNLEVAALSVKVAAVVAGALSLFVPPNPVTMAVATICGIASFALVGVTTLLLDEDPFSHPRDVWYERLAARVRAGFGQVTDRLESISTQVS